MRSDNSELLAMAREYCDLIEHPVPQPRQWLRELARLLPRLNAAVAAQQADIWPRPRTFPVDLDQRFELFSRIRQILGELDGYWMEFDVAADGQEMSGSLADDLNDIYWELKEALQRLERSNDARRAAQRLRASYQVHWGQHLLDAERHLYALRARRRGGWAAFG